MNDPAQDLATHHKDSVTATIVAPGIERADVRLMGSAFSPHRHDTYAIGYTTRGVQSFDYRGSTHHALPGTAFVLHPDERHDGRPGTPDGFGYRILYLAPELIGSCLDRPSLPFVTEPVCGRSRLRRAILAALAEALPGADELRQAAILEPLAAALADASDDQRKRRSVTIDRRAIERVRRRLHDAVVEGLSIAELERQSGLGRWSLYRQFRQAYGVSPYRYLTMRRLDFARHRIGRGDSLAGAAIASGFADQSDLTRHFRRTFGLTPGHWRALAAGTAAGAPSGPAG